MPLTITTTMTTYIPGDIQQPYPATTKQGFFGVTPIIRPAATAESAVATTAITTLATTPTATDIAVAVNSLISRQSAAVTLVNQLRSDLVNLGLITGAAS